LLEQVLPGFLVGGPVLRPHPVSWQCTLDQGITSMETEKLRGHAYLVSS
jgi:hypothetical protein